MSEKEKEFCICIGGFPVDLNAGMIKAVTNPTQGFVSKHNETMNAIQNLFADTPSALPQELVEILSESAGVRIERIVSHGHASPEGFWYDQDRAEFVILLRGAARLHLEGDNPVEMNLGDWINIPAHRRHRVEWTTPDEPSVWLAVHY
jgi:cupin 2 domain-containing protein